MSGRIARGNANCEHRLAVTLTHCAACGRLMPEVDGFQVASQIRKPDFPHQPVLIAFSALNDSATINLAMRSGFDYHLPKPATIKQVITVIANARSRKQNPTPAFANPGEGQTPATGEVPSAFIYKSGF